MRLKELESCWACVKEARALLGMRLKKLESCCAGVPISQDRAGWGWQPIATTTAWNFQYGVLLP